MRRGREGSRDYPEKLELFRDRYRRSDGERWKDAEISRATSGYVSSSYLTSISRGTTKQPGPEYLKAIADVMGFPVEYWFRTVEELRSAFLDQSSEQKGADVGEMVVLRRPQGFTAQQKLLLQAVADSLK